MQWLLSHSTVAEVHAALPASLHLASRMLIILLNKMVGGSWWKMTPQLSFLENSWDWLQLQFMHRLACCWIWHAHNLKSTSSLLTCIFFFQQKSALESLAVGRELSFILSPCLLACFFVWVACRLHAEVIMRNNDNCNVFHWRTVATVPLPSFPESKAELCNPIWQSFLRHNVPPNLKRHQSNPPRDPLSLQLRQTPSSYPH